MGPHREELRTLVAVVTRLLGDANRLLAQAVDPMRIGVLRLVVARGPLRPLQIAEGLDLSPSAVIRQVCALEEDELVRLASGPGALRGSWLVVATARGHEELHELDQASADVLALVVDRWSGEDVRRLTTLLTRLGEDCLRFQRTAAARVQPSLAGPTGVRPTS